jgi:hypothetical protein
MALIRARSNRWWPDPQERRRLLVLCLRRQRRPGTPHLPPVGWRSRRLLFWWTLATWAQDQPLLVLAALAAWPAWLIFRLWQAIRS